MAEELMTVNHVSREFGVSTRMLRHYEKMGLLQSSRAPGYAYRMYTAEAVAVLRQILILRKLRIPLKDIKAILQDPKAVTAIAVFEQSIAELDVELEALGTIRSILAQLVEQLQKTAQISLRHLLTADAAFLTVMETIAPAGNTLKEGKTMEDLQRAEKGLLKLTDVRIVTLPPFTVAAAHYIGDEPEQQVNETMKQFVRQSNLCQTKPDLRCFGFNHPNPKDETGFHGYESWVTIPEDMEVPAPLVKKQFTGGLYAAHMIAFGNFQEWDALLAWANQNEKYDFAGDMADQEHMCGLMEEHLNYVAHVSLDDVEPEDTQMDLWMPIKPKNNM